MVPSTSIAYKGMMKAVDEMSLTICLHRDPGRDGL